MKRLKEFSGEPSPPDKATFEKLAEYWRIALICEFDHVSDEIKAKFAEFFDLYVTVRPMESSNGYGFNMTLNVPLEMEGYTPNAYDMLEMDGYTPNECDMVFSPPRGGLRGISY